MALTMRFNEQKTIFSPPNGLRELSNDIVREVLRFQPEDINGFIASYLEMMVEMREKISESAQIIANVQMQGYFLSNLQKNKGIDKKDADMYATRIQANWRGYVVRKKLSEYLIKLAKIEKKKKSFQS